MKIQNWSIVTEQNPYTPPECRASLLHGKVYGHPNFTDGEEVTTTCIMSGKGRTVKTASGSTYRLGSIDPNYRKYIKKIMPEWDWRNPIKSKHSLI